MNQIPNIEETNSREVEELLPTEMDLIKVGNHYWGGDYEPQYQEIIQLQQSFKEILTPKIEKFLHQELQKAREEEAEQIALTVRFYLEREDTKRALDYVAKFIKDHSELDQDKK